MGSFQYQWWLVDVQAVSRSTWEVKAKNKANAIKAIKKMARDEDGFIQKGRPDFHTEIFWDTLRLDRIGYQRI